MSDSSQVVLPTAALERYRNLGTVWTPVFALLTLSGVLFSIHEIFRLGWVNQKKLAHLEKVNKRWTAFAEDAQDRMAKTGKKVDLAKEWRDLVEKEVGLVAE